MPHKSRPRDKLHGYLVDLQPGKGFLKTVLDTAAKSLLHRLSQATVVASTDVHAWVISIGIDHKRR